MLSGVGVPELTRCTNNSYDDIDKEAAEDAANTELGDRDRKMRQLLREEKRGKVKRRKLGNIRFIGELFKQSILTDRIMHYCVQSLLNHGNIEDPDEENIEALCHLLTMIGKQLEVSRVCDCLARFECALSLTRHMLVHCSVLQRRCSIRSDTKAMMDQYFSLFKQLSTHKKLPSRLRLMVVDLIELRSLKWRPRHGEKKLLTTVEFRKEEAKRQQQAAR